jgi:hypothetical protein
MNLRYLLLAPALGLSSLFTACETTTVAYESGPAYADYDDTDFYYVSGSPYSHRYGVLVLRDGGYYYSRGGRYYAYSRHGYHHDHDNYRRHDSDRVVYNNTTYNNTYRRTDVRTQPSAHYSTTNRAGGYHGTTPATRTNVNVQRTGVSTNTKVRAGAQPAAVQVKKGKHGDHDHDRD